ncbi:hypothetical protein DB88DRAFT_498514 [Papiliotrema laurentii]|uniref:PH domain-like protein n=1 Tax=Papiliotrema laurentii TaxID=5418 RepID=A0AAD9CYR5_PAPLA|nr:hypothetical protein DB88DRAFT_498514 [Papiliotrema laurentii]
MYTPAGPSGALPPRPGSAAEDDRIAAFKQSTNFRSVTRNDPSVVEILDTSVYSVIYLYDEAAGAWEKQKQEGPLFIVRRDKAPEYALYMLNRQAVKNVTMPLIPGEMKATIVDPTTLQVARRGEKVKRGIWFSDGAEDVERFRQTILRCVH